MDVKQLYDEQQKAWNEFKATDAERIKEIKQLGAVTSETATKLGEINKQLDSIEDLANRISSLEAGKNRPSWVGNDPNEPVKPTEAKAAFMKWVRTGSLSPDEAKLLTPMSQADLSPAQRKVLQLGDATAAGYLAPPEYVREILKGIVEFSPIRTLARIRQTSSQYIEIPKRTATFAAAWVAETGTRTETTGLTYGLEKITPHEMYAFVDVTAAMLEDSAFNLEDELSQEFSQQFGKLEGTAFVSGSGPNQPEGVLTNAAIAYTASGDANLITADGLINLFYAVMEPYANNGFWALKRATLGTVRALKDAANQYVWTPALGGFGVQLAGGQPAAILGRPYIECPDMPAIAGNAFPVVFGDWNAGYTIVDRIDMVVVRDIYTQAATGKVRFFARRRVGGQVVLAEALRKLKIATS